MRALVCRVAQRWLKQALRCKQPVTLIVTLITVFVVLILTVFLTRPAFIRWQLVELAGDRHLLTFHSTPHWGIGNAMFAFASTLAIARSMTGNSSPIVCFDSTLSLREGFLPLADWPACSPGDVLKVLGARRLVEHSYARYDRRLVHGLPRDQHVVLDRFLQSWKYFANIEAELSYLFRFHTSVWHAAADAVEKVISNRDNCTIKIGIHVRRGDIIEQESLMKRGYVTADISYLERAMDFMDQHLGIDSNTGLNRVLHRRVFIVCSDDISWCIDNMPAQRLKHVEFVSTGDAVVDLAVLAMCQHTIITVGTFGWWAAWLANGTTIYYKNWPRHMSDLARETSHADYFPPLWIPL